MDLNASGIMIKATMGMPGLQGDLKHGFHVNNDSDIVYMVKTDLWFLILLRGAK